MGNLTKGMSVKETRAWIAEKNKNRSTMPLSELNEFNDEMRLLEEEWSARWDVKVYRFFKNIVVWIAATLIILSGWAYHWLD